SGDGGTGNPDLKSESAYSFYTGLLYSQKFEVSVKPFLIFYKDKIGWVSDTSGSWSPDNWGSSVNWGADFYFSTKELFGNLEFSASYTFCKAVLTSGGSTDGNQIMYTPVHTFSLTEKYSFFNDFIWTTVFSYNSKKYTSNSNILYVPDYFNLDTSLSWTGKKFYAQFLWQNVFDFQYVHVDGYPAPGTSFTLSAGIKL
ncbi:MAG: TonB-dependent receptor, partial [Treponema sp.]|nr:TonB-dependent receptor [Treponema sp.]